VAALLAGSTLATLGTDGGAIVTALRLTARWAFLPFWLAYTGGALAKLFGGALAPLARRGRELGLAYAAAQLVHLALVVWLFWISPQPPVTGRLFLFFAIGILWTYLLAALSFGQLRTVIGLGCWRLLMLAGMNYILLAFARDFLSPLLHEGIGQGGDIVRAASLLPFAALCVAAPILRLAAAAHGAADFKAGPAAGGS
jgi:hypothetical protein